MKIDLNKKYIFNNAYKIRSDVDRIVITNNDSIFVDSSIKGKSGDKIMVNFSWFMNPYIALLLSYFQGDKTLGEIVNELSEDINLPNEEIMLSISKLIENEESIIYSFGMNKELPIPKNVLVENNDGSERLNILNDINIEQMYNSQNFNQVRFNKPDTMAIMINKNCYTDCIYCYVDRKYKLEKTLSLKKIEEIICEARSLGIRDCAIAGGDLFCYEYWKELLICLRKNNYNPYISTKHPLTESDIKELASIGIDKIQFSLDSIDEEKLIKILNVKKGYFQKVDNTLKLLSKYGIKFHVKSVITKHNDALEDVESLINYLLSYENLIDYSIAPGSYNIHSDFDSFRTTKDNFKRISDYVRKLDNNKVSCQEASEPISDKLSFENKVKMFSNLSICSGNLSSFLVLPDGLVTLCEQTYWNPNLLIGDLNYQSIMEMWNSKKALSLWNISQSSMKESNPCKSCTSFDRCRRGKGVCWRNAYESYGIENFDYPIPQCPMAPKVERDIYIK